MQFSAFQPSFEYDYLNHLTTRIEYCLNWDDVTVLKLGQESCDGARETFDVVAIPRSKRSLLQFLREENNNSFIASFLLHNSTLNRGHQGFKAARGGGVTATSVVYFSIQAAFSMHRGTVHWHTKTRPPTCPLLASQNNTSRR